MPKRMLTIFLAAAGSFAADQKKPVLTPLDRYIQEVMNVPSTAPGSATGSLWSATSRLSDLGSDLRATQVNDLITIVVSESASAVSQGTTKAQRQSSLKSGVSAVAGVKSPTGALANLAGAATSSQLDGQGATTRNTVLQTTVSARVTQVLPNGYLVVEGNKEVTINSERQLVTVRGIVRPNDLSTANTVASDEIAQMELRINGKGVVGDAVRRPFILYRILMGLLPF